MEKHTIIIVEDDEITALNLKLSLQKHGYDIIAVCDNAVQAREKIDEFKPNVIIIDISLQESNDGIELAKTIRQHYTIPFIYLTSYSDDDIIAEAIKTEPYGYIVKPFDPSSLHATIQMAIFKFEMENKRYEEINASKIDEQNIEKLLYAKREAERPIVLFGDNYYIDISKDEIFYNNEKIKLTKKENAILRLLVAKHGHVISFNHAIDYVWKDNGATENSIRTLVWRLRSKLPTDIIKNASGIGYYIEK
ncbi:MAG: transcriptional regulator [Sulfurimonas sp. RIFCSPHIGHO2_12_FULL_36_9]|uniref:response regulator transcription factor n=1 Tax=unclassified Sulfurimonas TaxID=2623549 RepID=UPI0008CCC3FF|nr:MULTISPECIES: response regulator [unclassified Sulfurimonas]OHD97646.1 MAG: transcriptional regulator [Sulfurimonas sp. RIFCSPLOWO2_02_FULL_36_28]OHD98485.1 MAG: transcriptional regulator [Sulfurimonas sp. RIFCSPHIGHO2_12_FULL_36_9]OHE02199.1 MAG: transcriptional regulator [Sulfurimonas sp. RIFCSPLOWO2_12_36_12]OHE07336.1 MAG: transcriptional regulator [Sulfurimonas sp. RIFCSPLOWO2_12_FULL_36_74]